MGHLDSQRTLPAIGGDKGGFSPTSKKLRLAAWHKVAVLNAPDGYLARLSPGPSDIRTDLQGARDFDTVQLFANTAPEKYATFFFGIYDDESRTLTYTNAGHLPPLLVRRGSAIPLEVTGTVVGAFPAAAYEEQSISIEPGDLLIAYTDGITEPENAYGEEFGAARLAEVATRHQHAAPLEIVAKIMDAVKLWSHTPELPDDMTVVIARGLA